MKDLIKMVIVIMLFFVVLICSGIPFVFNLANPEYTKLMLLYKFWKLSAVSIFSLFVMVVLIANIEKNKL